MVLCARLACAQEFFLHQSQYYHGEEIVFDLWLSEQDSSSYVYVVLLDAVNQRPLDHHPYLISHRLTQGRFLPDFKDLPTGPYLVAAIGDKGSFLGAIPIFMTRYTERDWYAKLLTFLAGDQPHTLAHDHLVTLPEVFSIKTLKNSEVFMPADWQGAFEWISQMSEYFLEVTFKNESGNNSSFLLPPAARLGKPNLQNKNDLFEFWLKNGGPETMDYSLSWEGYEYIHFELPPKDSVLIDRRDFPAGILQISDGDNETTVINNPDIKNFSEDILVMIPGEERRIKLPEILNPHSESGRFLVGISISSNMPTMSKKGISHVLIEDIENWPPFFRATVNSPKNKMPKDFKGYVVMDSIGQYQVQASEDGTFEMWAYNVNQLSREEGRIRLSKMDEQLSLSIRYPELETFIHLLSIEGAFTHDDLRWIISPRNALFPEAETKHFDLFDLDEVVVAATTMDELVDHFDQNPFSEYWINTDFICGLGVLNCDDPKHRISAGNHPDASIKIPLNIYLQAQKTIESKVRAEIERARFTEGIKQNITWQISANHVSPSIRGGTFSLQGSRMDYKWDVSRYMHNMEKLRFFFVNDFREDFSFERMVELGANTVWGIYDSNEFFLLKAPLMAGEYFVRLHYFDPLTNVQSLVLLSLEVR